MADENQIYASILLKRIHESDFTGDKVYLTAGNDKQKFPIDTNVLAAASKYFKAALGPNFEEGEKEEFVLEGADAGTVKTIVDYCYTGLIELTEENVGKFLAIASSVQLDLLEAKCRRFYGEKLSITNCGDVLVVADRYSYADMRQRAFGMVCVHFEELPSADIQKLDHQLVQELLECDKIQATEEVVFKRLLEWFQYSETDRSSHMPELLKLIRLDLLSGQFMYDTLEVVYEKCNCSKLVVAEYRRRTLAQRTKISGRRFGFNVGFNVCLFTQFKGENGAQQSAIKIEKFNPMLISFEDAGEIALGDLVNFGVVLLQNKIYVLGGYLNGKCLQSVSAFDLESGAEETLPPMSFARACFTPISHGKYIYAFSSFGCERFDTETKTWSVTKSMNDARYSFSVTQMNDFICVADGFSKSVELYDPTKDEWTQIAPMHTYKLDFVWIKLNELMYAIGGIFGTIERYDQRQNSWMKVGSFKDSGLVTSAINIRGKPFVIMTNGEFGQITINESGELSFVRLAKSKYASTERRRHFLYQN